MWLADLHGPKWASAGQNGNNLFANVHLVDVSEIFFVCSGRGKGKSEARRQEGGRGWFLLKIPGEGMGRGAGRVSAANWGSFFFWGGGGLNMFFSRPKRPPSSTLVRNKLLWPSLS